MFVVIQMFFILGFAANSHCEFPDPTVPRCRAQPSSTQRIRRELKDLSSEEWGRIVDAMWVIRETPLAQGRAEYGPAYRDWDYFILKHAIAASDNRGDVAHLGDWFMTWHAAFLLEFENALHAVDPEIEGVPYLNPSRWNPFTPEYLGSVPGTGENFQVVDGPFANWPITQNFDIDIYKEYIRDIPDVSYTYERRNNGFLRGNSLYMDNTNENPYLTRLGNTFPFREYDHEEWMEDFAKACTQAPGFCWSDFAGCIDNVEDAFVPGKEFHVSVHFAVGGLDPDTGLMGELFDPNVSPTDPTFFLMHAYIDKLRMEYQKNHRDIADIYYGYKGILGTNPRCERPPWFPAHVVQNPFCDTCDDWCPTGGVNLKDPLSSLFPFTSDDLQLDDLDMPNGVTHQQILCNVGPETAPYKYAEAGNFAYVGCFKDGSYFAFGPRNYGFRQESCRDACRGFHYFALQNNGFCSCGNKYGANDNIQVDDTECGADLQGEVMHNAVYENYKVQRNQGVTCKLTVDNVLTHVRYNGIYLQLSGDLNSWQSTKTFSLPAHLVEGAYLEIGGYEFSDCNGCACSGLLLECDNGFVSSASGWEAYGSDNEIISPSYGFGNVCISASKFRLRGSNPQFNAQKIWPSNGKKHAWFRTMFPTWPRTI